MINSCPKPVKQKKSKKVTTGKLHAEIDRIESDYALIEADFVCMLCGGVANQIHHFFTKSTHGNVRHDRHNHCPLCFGCHSFKITKRADTEPLRDLLIAKLGAEEFGRLKVSSKLVAEFGRCFLQDLLAQRKAELLLLAGDNPERIERITNAGKQRLQSILEEMKCVS